MVHVTPIPAAAPAATLLAADDPDEVKPIVDILTQTRKSLTLRSLFMTGFPHDPEFFAAGMALARQWSRQGLKVAVVDLDYRNPTLARPRPSPEEGFVDALEYGCSFQRVAWELIADSLWLVGSGSHPPDEERFAAHPDWTRVMRIFSARVDVTIYLAPFLDRKGFTGALSKRMDGVLLAASVRRTSRAALRDAFLELWGSDAPMIGCIGIDVPYDPVPRWEVQLTAEPTRSAAQPAAPAAPGAVTPSASAPSAPPAAPVPPRASEWAFPSPDSPPARPSSAPERRDAARAPGDPSQRALVARLSDEVRRGQAPRAARPRGRGLLLAALALALAGAGALVTYRAMHREGAHAAAPAETLPAGTERVLPADIGVSAGLAGPGSVPPDQGAAPQGGAAQAAPPASAQAPAPAPPAPAPAKRAVESPKRLAYEVHVASFNEDSKARDLVKRLHARGLDAWYAKATDQRNWYRVFVGHYATHEEAARRAASMLDKGQVEHAIAFPDHAR